VGYSFFRRIKKKGSNINGMEISTPIKPPMDAMAHLPLSMVSVLP
jgi:hypothetical protein